MSERIRFTITVTPEVHEAVTRMAAQTGVSLGRCVGDWLQDTLEGMQMVTNSVAQVRQRPRVLMMEMDAVSAHLVESQASWTPQRDASIRVAPLAGRSARERSSEPSASVGVGENPDPPSSNTGGKVPQQRSGRGVKVSGSKGDRP